MSAAPVVLVVMGVSGAGKSTVARGLAGSLGWTWQEGDELHPPENVAKMSAGRPLTDEDRAAWLDRVAAWVRDRAESGLPGIITCSSLKREYRDRLRGDGVVFVYLRGSRDLIGARLAVRRGHFMPASLLGAQIADLEPPGDDEGAITISVDIGPAEEVAAIVAALEARSTAG